MFIKWHPERDSPPPPLKNLQSELFNCIIILLFHRFLGLHPVIPEHLFSLLPPLEHLLLTGIHRSPRPPLGASHANGYTRIPLLPLEHPLLTGIHGSPSPLEHLLLTDIHGSPAPPLEHPMLTGIHGSHSSPWSISC